MGDVIASADSMSAADGVSAVAGILISLFCSYVPGVRDRFAALDGTRKRLCILCALLAAAVVIFAGSCAQVIDATSCTRNGAVDVLRGFIVAAVASQSAFLLSPTKS